MLNKIKNLVSEEQGQGMAEYGLILAAIAIVAMAALTPLGKAIATKFNEITTAL